MTDHEKKIELMRKYALDINTSFSFHVKGEIPSKIIDNAIRKFAFGLDRTTIIGFYDTTITNSGKLGYIFTDSSVYYLETLEKPKVIDYEEISYVDVSNTHKRRDCDRELNLYMSGGWAITWDSVFLNKTPLCNFFNEMLEMIRAPHISNEMEEEYVETSVEKENVPSANNTGTLAEVICRLYHCGTWTDAMPDSGNLEPVAGFSYDNSLPMDIIDELGIKSDVGRDLSTVLGVLGEGKQLSAPSSDGIVFTQTGLLVYSHMDRKNPERIRYKEMDRIDARSAVEIVIHRKKDALRHPDGKKTYSIHVNLWNRDLIRIFLQFVLGEYGFYQNGALLRNISVEDVVEQIVKMEGLQQHEWKPVKERPRRAAPRPVVKCKTILVTGTMSAGKSTLINALIGKRLLQTAQDACTEDLYWIYNDFPLSEEVCRENGDRSTIVPYQIIACAPGNICLIDTPGVDSAINQSHGVISKQALKECPYNILLYVLNGGRIATDSEMDYLKYAAANVPQEKVIFVLNKLDAFNLRQDSIEESIQEVENDLIQLGYEDPVVLPISAYLSMLIKLRLAGEKLDEDEEDELAYYIKKYSRPEYSLAHYYEVPYSNVGTNTLTQTSVKCGLYGLETILLGA